MAYFFRKRGKVYVCYSVNGKVKALPRTHTQHLDTQPDHNIDHFVSGVAAQYENRSQNPDNIVVPADLRKWLENYRRFLAGRKKDPNTIQAQLSVLERHVIPYFLKLGCEDPTSWPAQSIGISNLELSPAVHMRVQAALRGFYNFLQDERRVTSGISIRLRRPVINQTETPLQSTLSPEEVLRWVRATDKTKLKLLALLGYFFSLRPQESLAVKPENFASGEGVRQLECGRVAAGVELPSVLALYVGEQLSGGKLKPPKAYSKGWVNCFNREAASIIAGLVNDAGPGLLIQGSPRRTYRLWKMEGIPGITLKDLRRASLYWLGHHSRLGERPQNLQKHARHRYLTTTELYLRRPGEQGPGIREKLVV